MIPLAGRPRERSENHVESRVSEATSIASSWPDTNMNYYKNKSDSSIKWHTFLQSITVLVSPAILTAKYASGSQQTVLDKDDKCGTRHNRHVKGQHRNEGSLHNLDVIRPWVKVLIDKPQYSFKSRKLTAVAVTSGSTLSRAILEPWELINCSISSAFFDNPAHYCWILDQHSYACW